MPSKLFWIQSFPSEVHSYKNSENSDNEKSVNIAYIDEESPLMSYQRKHTFNLIGHICFSKSLFMSVRHMKKMNIEILGSYYFFLFSLHWAIYLHKPVYIFALQVSLLLLNMQNVGYIYYYICLSLCHILYFDAAQFSLKQFSLS